MLIDIQVITALHDDAILQWKQQQLPMALSSDDCVLKVGLKQSGFLALVEENHGFNYQLWHAEDRARRDDLGHSFVYWAKREIDWCNQQRNDRIEMIDEWILKQYNPPAPGECRVNSETPGMMLDRLSILSLKIYHMMIQAQRQTADESHRKKCHEKWQILILQRNQLKACFDDLMLSLLNRLATFSSYQQFKMYNDKQLNPELYSS